MCQHGVCYSDFTSISLLSLVSPAPKRRQEVINNTNTSTSTSTNANANANTNTNANANTNTNQAHLVLWY